MVVSAEQMSPAHAVWGTILKWDRPGAKRPLGHPGWKDGGQRDLPSDASHGFPSKLVSIREACSASQPPEGVTAALDLRTFLPFQSTALRESDPLTRHPKKWHSALLNSVNCSWELALHGTLRHVNQLISSSHSSQSFLCFCMLQEKNKNQKNPLFLDYKISPIAGFSYTYLNREYIFYAVISFGIF